MLVDGEHAVSVAIEGGSQIGMGLDDLLAQISHVFRLDGAGGVVGKIAVQLKVQRDEFAGQMLEDFGHDHARHAVARVDDDFERLDFGDIDERERVFDKVIGHIALDDLSFALWAGEIATDCNIADIAQAGIDADGKAWARQNLMPLYLPGLCEAVIITPAGS